MPCLACTRGREVKKDCVGPVLMIDLRFVVNLVEILLEMTTLPFRSVYSV